MNILIQLIVALAVMGIVLYCVTQLPIAGWIKNVINALAALLVLLWVLSALGVSTGPFHLR